MVDCRRSALESHDGECWRFAGDAGDMTWRDFLARLADDAAFRARFGALLGELPYRALRWECRPVTSATLDLPFECVVLNSPEIDVAAERGPFADQFARLAAGGIGTFPNLGGDATMVVPAPVDAGSAYAHLAAFLRTSPAAQQDAMWRATAAAATQRVDDRPAWLNTAGGGVAWLHVRVDDRPKYYRFAPYRDPGFRPGQ